MLLEKEAAHWDRVAAHILVVPLYYINGADAVSLYHTKRALELNPNNIGLKQLLLSFYTDLPAPLLTEEETISLANEILILDPNNPNAKEALEKCHTKK